MIGRVLPVSKGRRRASVTTKLGAMQLKWKIFTNNVSVQGIHLAPISPESTDAAVVAQSR